MITLRALEPADAALHHRWFDDVEVTRWLPAQYPLSLAGIEQGLRDAAPPAFGAARFTVLAGGAPVGYAALRGATPESRAAELGLVVGERSAWGRGYGTEAARATCRYGFDRLGLHRVQLWVCAENAAAVRAFEKAGFTYEGRARDRMFRHGRFHDLLLMGLLATEAA